MKILLLTDSFNYCCGRSRHVQLLAKSLQLEGHTVFVVYGSGDGAPMLKNDGILYAKRDYLLHDNRSTINYLRAAIFLFYLQLRRQFDIIHTHHRYAAALARISAWLFRIPLVMSIHGTVKNIGIFPAYIGDHFIAVSESVGIFASSDDPSISRNLSIIPNGIDLSSRFEETSGLRKRLIISNDTIVVSMIGRIVEHKGHRILLDAMSHLKKGKSFVFLVVGEGGSEYEIRKYAEKMGVNTFFTGVVEDPYQYYSLSDIIVIPSLNYEGLPITLLEAGRHTKPVIVSDIAGMHDLVKNGFNGFVTKPGDVQAVTFALEQLMNDESLRQKFGKALSEVVTKEYSAEHMTKRYISLYRLLVRKGKYAE